MSSPSKIAKILVQAVDSTGELGQKVACESFWKENRCVIIFFRRYLFVLKLKILILFVLYNPNPKDLGDNSVGLPLRSYLQRSSLF